MELHIDPRGGVRCLYTETIPLQDLGVLKITRASHVEPDNAGRWWAELSPMGGPKLGPFAFRSEALDAERRWLEARLFT